MKFQAKPKSFAYDVDVIWTSERKGRIEADGKPPVEVATPPEFKGHPGYWSPEDLFVQAVNVCLMCTFVGTAARQQISFLDYRCHARGILETADGMLQFTEIILEPVISLPAGVEIEAARKVLQDAKRNCLVANSITAHVQMNENIISCKVVES